MLSFNKNLKTLMPLSAVIFSLFSLSSCGESKFLDKPNETNLEFWITEEASHDSFKNCTFLPGLFGGDMYLDSRYEGVIREGSLMVEAPEIHVVYTVTSYPDYSDGGSYVTGIDITDPNINVYGLTMKSSKDEISKTLSNLGFLNDKNNCWRKNNCWFTFGGSGIYIGAHVSNDKGYIF